MLICSNLTFLFQLYDQPKILADLEDEIQAPIASRFDLIAGTSIGGILALAVAMEIPARQIVDLFTEHGEQIFKRRWSLNGIMRAPLARRAWFDTPQESRPLEMKLEIAEKFKTWDQFVRIVTLLREEHPTLRLWRASRAYLGDTSYSIISFEDLPPDSDELASELWERHHASFTPRRDVLAHSYLQANLRIDGTLICTRPREYHLVSPVNGKSINCYSLQLAALHLLSSLSRYRPSVWMHALSRAAVADRPADDQLLALIEQF